MLSDYSPNPKPEALNPKPYRHTVGAISLQETAAKSLWVCCCGESPSEAFVRFTLGKSAGIEPLLIVAKTGRD